MRKSVKINFVKFWPTFSRGDNFFTRLIAKNYDVVISDEPDFVFYSVFAGEMPKGEYVKIFYSGENVRPDFEECDWAFTFDYDEELNHPRHSRLPLYVVEPTLGPQDLIKKDADIDVIKKGKLKFCNFIYTNDCSFRTMFFGKLSEYKKVDAPGRCMNNMPRIPSRDVMEGTHTPDLDKLDFMKDYKFSIVMENSSYPGYTTEKITDAMRVNSIPIYWGNPLISRDFNTKSFVSYHDFEKLIKSRIPKILFKIPKVRGLFKLIVQAIAINRVIKRVIEIDGDDGLYDRYLKEPWFNGNMSSASAILDKTEEKLKEIFG